MGALTNNPTNRRRATVEVEPKTGMFRIVKGDLVSPWATDIAVLRTPDGMYFASAADEPFGRYNIYWAVNVRGKVVGV